MNFNEVRRQYPTFVYRQYRVHTNGSVLELVFDFEIPDLASFHPTWQIPLPANNWEVMKDAVHHLAFSLGMVELVSYWKTTCSPRVEIRSGALSSEQAAWWKKLYFNGLGEFFHINGIETNRDEFMQIHATGQPLPAISPWAGLEGCLVPVGGGKDSAVTLELLQQYRDNSCCYFINERSSSRLCARTAGYGQEKILVAKRTLDPRMLELNRQGFFNGHTPFSAVVAFSAVLTALLHGKRYVVLSNEASANDPTLSDSEVNHQYSKSFEFEQDFSTYLQRYIPCGVEYFSLLRPFSELQIAALFAQMPAYHSIFRSCNRGSKQDIWCGDCPKCLFVALLLTPFLDDGELAAIFGDSLLEKQHLWPLAEELTGLRPNKPFECVGSREELHAAIGLGIQRRQTSGAPLPPLLAKYQEAVPGLAEANPYESYYNKDHLIPSVFEELVKSAAGRCWQ